MTFDSSLNNVSLIYLLTSIFKKGFVIFGQKTEMPTTVYILHAIKSCCQISNASSENVFIVYTMFASDKMRIFTIMGPTTIPNKHHAMMLMWALLLLQVRTDF